MSWRLTLLIVATVAACTTPPKTSAGTPDYRSGARLRAMVLDGGAGARVLGGWFDGRFQLPCVFQTANDGVLRCLPAATHASVFADPQCTMRGVLLPSCEAPPTYVSLPASDTPTGCGFGHLAVYRVGSVANVILAYARDDFGSCGQVAFGNEAFHLVGDPILASEFVPATTLYAAAGGGVLLRRIVAVDGAEQADVFADPMTRAPCTSSILDLGGEDSGRCIPVGSPIATDDVYADNACSQSAHVARIAIATGVDCPPSSGLAIAVHPPAVGDCALPTFDVRPIGDPLPTTNLYTPSGNACGPLVLSGPEELRALGAPVPPTMFGALQIAHRGSGPLQTNTFVDPSGAAIAVLPGTAFFDAARGEACTTTTIGGTSHCVPKSATANVTGYADAACTQPVLGVPKANTLSCNGAPAAVVLGTGACGYPLSVWSPGNITMPATVYDRSSDGASCQPATIDPTFDYYALTPGDPAVFPVVRSFIE